MDRSYLFAPGHNAKLLDRVFDAGADAVMLDLEDAVPPDAKETARAMVAEALLDHPAWVRVNAAQTAWCEADLDAVAERAFGIRIPKVESAGDVEWVTARAPGKPIICAIESARGVLAARRSPQCPVFGFWPWVVSTCSATSTPPAGTCKPFMRGHIWCWRRVRPGSSRPSTASSPCSMTPPGFATKPVRPIVGVFRQIGDPSASAGHPP